MVVAGVSAAIGFGAVLPIVVIAAAFLGAHAFPIPNPEGRSISQAAMVAMAVLIVREASLVEVLGGAALGMPFGWWLVRSRAGSRALDHMFPAEPVALVVAAGAYAGLRLLVGRPDPASLGGALLVLPAAAAWFLAVAAVRAFGSGRRRRSSPRSLWAEAMRDMPAYLSLFTGGGLFGIAYPAMSWWAVPLALLPYGFSHLSFERLARTRRTYRQTIGALGRIPEAAGLSPMGHAARTGDLAVAVAGELRLPPREARLLEFAGLLHDVGRVALNDPSIAAAGYSEADVAAWGAAIIEEAPTLEPVASVVAAQHQPYRRAGEARNDRLPVASQVVRVTSTYDRSVYEGGCSPVDALEVLHRNAAYDFDPEVVAALRRVLQRRRVPGV
jgi:hypothetical protein